MHSYSDRRAGRLELSIRTADKTGQISETERHVEEGKVTIKVQADSRNEVYLASVIVPRTSSTRDITVLETAMQGLALNERHPVALELAATASSRHFLLRATSALSLQHLADQVQARYPQAIIRPFAQEDDPLCAESGRNGLSSRIARGRGCIPTSTGLARTRTATRRSRSSTRHSGRVQPPANSHACGDPTCAHSSVPDVVAQLSSQVRRTPTRTGTPTRKA